MALLAWLLILSGCAGTDAAQDKRPLELRFDHDHDLGSEHDAVVDATESDTNSRESNLDALRGFDDDGRSMLSLLSAGQPPISGPLEVASAIGDHVMTFSGSSLVGEGKRFPNPTQFGGPRVFRVLDSTSHPDVIQVSLPVKPNGQTGWIARNAVEVTEVGHQVLVNLADHTVTVWGGDQVLSHTLAVTGTAWTPTPTGIFFMRDIIKQGNDAGPYGSYILALSGFSEVLDSFGGGLPAIAIHGTNKPDSMGQERSNGCVRVPNEIIQQLADELPLGTPVVIVDSSTTLGFGQTTDMFDGRRIF